MGLTALGLHPVSEAPGEDPRSMEGMLQGMKTDDFRRAAEMLFKRGIDLEFELHAMRFLMPPENFREHPQWFRVNEHGSRSCDFNCCVSCWEALDFVQERARLLAEQIAPFSTSHRYSFWTSDSGKFCHCEKCRELSLSDQALILYNRILRGIREEDPQASHSFLAYQNTMRAPEKVRPDGGIFLEFAPFDRDSSFAIGDKNCRRNAEQADTLGPLFEMFGTKGSQVLEYWLDISRFYQWKRPFGELPFYQGVLRRDAEFYAARGFESITSFGCGLNAAYSREYGEYPMLEYGRILRECARQSAGSAI